MSWVSPTSHTDELNRWDYEPQAYDDDESTYALSVFYDNTGYLTLFHSALQSDKIRIKCYGPYCNGTITVAVRKNGVWVTLYSGAPWDGWKEFSFTQGSVDAMRMRAEDYVLFMAGMCVWEADFWEVAVAVVGVHFGDGLVTIQT